MTGTGPGGRVVKSDVEEAARSGTAALGAEAPAPAEAPTAPVPPAAAPPPAPPEPPPISVAPPAPPAPPDPLPTPPPTETGTAKGDVTIQELTRVQQVIARRMSESKATVPEFTLRSEIDMEECVRMRAELKALGTPFGAEAGDVPSYNDMVVKACALALREFPRANGSYRDGKFALHSRVNVGVAVAAADALVVPTIFDADRKSLREIARETRALAEKVRAGTVTPPELSGGTFTVSNLGMYGVTDFTAVINPPQAAILAVGALAPRAVVRERRARRAQHDGRHARLRPPHPLRRRRRAVPRPHPRAARAAARARVLTPGRASGRRAAEPLLQIVDGAGERARRAGQQVVDQRRAPSARPRRRAARAARSRRRRPRRSRRPSS